MCVSSPEWSRRRGPARSRCTGATACGPVFVDDPGVRSDRAGSVIVVIRLGQSGLLRDAGHRDPGRAGASPPPTTTLHPRVAIVNRRAAETLWPGQEPIGQQFRFEADGPPVVVVGVARDGRYNFLLESPQPFVYLPFAQQETVGEGFLAIRTTGDPHALDGPVRAVFKTASPDFVPAGFLSLDDIIQDGPNALLIFRLGAVSATVLGIVSLFLTLVGLYGVMSVGVTQRTRELGVRLALGATPGQVRRGVLRQAAAARRTRRRGGRPAARSGRWRSCGACSWAMGVGNVLAIGVVALRCSWLPRWRRRIRRRFGRRGWIRWGRCGRTSRSRSSHRLIGLDQVSIVASTSDESETRR